LAALAVALIDNWWSLFVRLAHPEACREAITSSRWLMSPVAIFKSTAPARVSQSRSR
jgi:hypothetical protein